MRKKQHTQKRLLTILCCGLFALSGMAQTMPDAMPGMARNEKASKAPEMINTPACIDESQMKAQMELTVENLLAVLDEYGVKHKEIVAAQAILETGNFTSLNCTLNHNLFGLRHPSDGSYYSFDTWEESVKAYRDDVQYKYAGGDYYAFLNRIGYAEDRRYTNKVRRIEKRLFPALLAVSETN
ncbi:MAG: glucosaminidase domain-containing protein [Prevotella sp.]|nr:glucosaminidase domain-containing protein [Prevotella sp.]